MLSSLIHNVELVNRIFFPLYTHIIELFYSWDACLSLRNIIASGNFVIYIKFHVQIAISGDTWKG